MILRELRKLKSHPAAADLYALVRRYLPRISLGTVYRNLELLTREGEIQKLELGGGQARFDGNPNRHFHIRCVRCERVDDVHGVPESRASADLDSTGYEVLDCRLEFSGICPDCQKGRRSER